MRQTEGPLLPASQGLFAPGSNLHLRDPMSRDTSVVTPVYDASARCPLFAAAYVKGLLSLHTATFVSRSLTASSINNKSNKKGFSVVFQCWQICGHTNVVEAHLHLYYNSDWISRNTLIPCSNGIIFIPRTSFVLQNETYRLNWNRFAADPFFYIFPDFSSASYILLCFVVKFHLLQPDHFHNVANTPALWDLWHFCFPTKKAHSDISFLKREQRS